jgi:major vault protein
MAADEERVGGRRVTGSREYTLPPGTYIQVQDGTSGKIKTYVGPTVVTLTGNDSPIVFDFEAGEGEAEFKPCDTLKEALRKSIVAPDGFYAVLMNPAKGSTHPIDGEVKVSPDLDVGNKIVVSGPRMFALWPGQSAKVIRGHHLRSNQFLICRVYNEIEARKNWSQAKMVKAAPVTTEAPEATAVVQSQSGFVVDPRAIPTTVGYADPAKPSAPEVAVVDQLTIGKLLIIKGTDYSFFIPPTGITVLAEKIEDGLGKAVDVYVRDAITLEQLQYCILLDEDGNKRYVHGPAVVFPEPTEDFIKDSQGNSIFLAVELNAIQGIHVKISKAYKDDVLGDLKEGQEIFITGKQFPIYFPREEHVTVKYDGKTKYFAVAVPEGTGRYVMNRMTGEVKLVEGPQMLLPNPVEEIITRRFLSDKECDQWYPGNAEAKEYNRQLREVAKSAPTTRAGAISEGDVERGSRRKGMESLRPGSAHEELLMYSASAGPVGATGAQGAQGPAHKMTRSALMASSNVSMSNAQTMGDEISRASTFTSPRTITLNTKFDGAPRITVWTGFAVMIVNTKGNRRVVEGPANVLLKYDETLESASMSTGKPKTTDKLIETPYLRVKNNKVADIVRLETLDHVVLDIKLSYLVNFEGDPNLWWNVENYVKFMCDHMRSLLKAAAKEIGIEQLYANPLPFVRQVVLGGKDKDAPGTEFEENGMKVSDVEVLDTVLNDGEVAMLLKNTQKATVQRSIMLADQRRGYEATKEQEAIKILTNEVTFLTTSKARDIEKRTLEETFGIMLLKIENSVTEWGKRLALKEAEELVTDAMHEASLGRSRAADEQRLELEREEQKMELELLVAQADNVVRRMGALAGPMSEALLSLSARETLVKISESLSVQKLAGGQNVVDVLGEIFDKSALGDVMKGIAAKAGMAAISLNGKAALPSADAKS